MSYSKNTKERKKKKWSHVFVSEPSWPHPAWLFVKQIRQLLPQLAASLGSNWRLFTGKWTHLQKRQMSQRTTVAWDLSFFDLQAFPGCFFFFYRLYCQLYANKAAYSVKRSAHLVFQFLTLWEAGIYHSGCYSYPLENIFLPFAPTQLTSYLKKNKKQNSLKPLIIDKNPLEKRRRSLLSPSPAANP